MSDSVDTMHLNRSGHMICTYSHFQILFGRRVEDDVMNTVSSCENVFRTNQATATKMMTVHLQGNLVWYFTRLGNIVARYSKFWFWYVEWCCSTCKIKKIIIIKLILPLLIIYIFFHLLRERNFSKRYNIKSNTNGSFLYLIENLLYAIQHKAKITYWFMFETWWTDDFQKILLAIYIFEGKNKLKIFHHPLQSMIKCYRLFNARASWLSTWIDNIITILCTFRLINYLINIGSKLSNEFRRHSSK